MRIPLIAAGLAFVVYWANLSAPISPDASSHVYLAYSWVRDGDADLREFAGAAPPYDFRAHRVGDRLYASYTPGNALLITPLVVVANALGIAPPSFAALGVLPKVMASLLVALSVAAVAAMLLLLVPRTAALFLTFVYAFGTAAFSVVSQIYLEHAGSIALIALALLVVIRRGPSRDGAVAGLFLGLAVLVRPSNLFIALAVLLWFMHQRRGSAPRYLLWAAAPAVFLFTFNLITLGALWGSTRPLPGLGDPIVGLVGNLVSPSRGILAYTPIVALALVGFAAAWRSRDPIAPLLRYASIAFVASLVLVSWYEDWWGGCSFGNRYLADLMPAYALGFALAVRSGWLERAWARRAFAVATGWSVFVHLTGASVNYAQWRSWTGFDLTPVFTPTTCAEGLWRVERGQLHYVFHVLANELPPGALLALGALAVTAVVYARLGEVPRASREQLAPAQP